MTKGYRVEVDLPGVRIHALIEEPATLTALVNELSSQLREPLDRIHALIEGIGAAELDRVLDKRAAKRAPEPVARRPRRGRPRGVQ